MIDMTELSEEKSMPQNEEAPASNEHDKDLGNDTAVESDHIEEPSELDILREEVASLRQALSQKIAEAEMIRGQLGEFSELFPNVAPENIPAEVWESITSGGSLAASYALYHRKEQLRRDRVRTLNNKNAELSTGKVGVDSAKEYFTPGEVRAMSRSEVHANYSKIINSMKKWN